MDSKFTFGTDIEAFILNKDGIEVTPLEIFPSGSPTRIEVENGVIERDGYAIEFQPNASSDISVLKENLRKLIYKFYELYPGYKLSNKHLVHVDLKKLIEMEDYPSLIFGCKPDYNIRNKDATKPNKKKSALKETARTAGAHVHVGILGWSPKSEDRGEYIFYSPENEEACSKALNLMLWMDLFLGLKSVMCDIPSERREVYGKAGDFRFTAYGIEYRTLSNFVLLHPATFQNFFNMAKIIAENMYTINYRDFVSQSHTKTCVDYINTCNYAARDYFNHYMTELRSQAFFKPFLEEGKIEPPKTQEIISSPDSIFDFWL